MSGRSRAAASCCGRSRRLSGSTTISSTNCAGGTASCVSSAPPAEGCPCTEDTLVQQTTADCLERLGRESVYAHNREDFGPHDDAAA